MVFQRGPERGREPWCVCLGAPWGPPAFWGQGQVAAACSAGAGAGEAVEKQMPAARAEVQKPESDGAEPVAMHVLWNLTLSMAEVEHFSPRLEVSGMSLESAHSSSTHSFFLQKSVEQLCVHSRWFSGSPDEQVRGGQDPQHPGRLAFPCSSWSPETVHRPLQDHPTHSAH